MAELWKKVFEELDEYIHSSSREVKIAELADTLEVIIALNEHQGVNIVLR